VRDERGQAALELIASVPALLLGMLVAVQLAATGYALHLADGAAEAGALALAAGTDPEDAARAALPGWAASNLSVDSDGSSVEVAVRPPAPHPAISGALEVTSSAWVRR
jgi:Flp pilus assembly protein TadG